MRNRHASRMLTSLLTAIAFVMLGWMADGASATSQDFDVSSPDGGTAPAFMTAAIAPCDALCVSQEHAEGFTDLVAHFCGGSAKCSFECEDGELEEVHCECM